MPFLHSPQTGKYNSDCVRSNIYTFFQPRSAQKEPPRLKPFLPKDTFPECGKNYICGEKFCHFLSHFRSRNVIINRGAKRRRLFAVKTDARRLFKRKTKRASSPPSPTKTDRKRKEQRWKAYAQNNGKLISSSYGTGVTINYYYDNLDRLVTKCYNNLENNAFLYTYNGLGALRSVTDTATGAKTLFTYDTIGRQSETRKETGNDIFIKKNT